MVKSVNTQDLKSCDFKSLADSSSASATMTKISKNWRKMQSVYKYFGDKNLDYSEKAALEMFLFESRGIGDLKCNLFNNKNGFANGKHWMDVTVAMWKKDIAIGLLSIEELHIEIPFHWWLDKILK